MINHAIHNLLHLRRIIPSSFLYVSDPSASSESNRIFLDNKPISPPYAFFRYVFVINMFYCIDLQFAFFVKKEYLLKKVKINILFSAPLKYTHYGEIYKNVDMRGEIL
jgi:hypothetical protein